MAISEAQQFLVHAEFSARALELGIPSWLCNANHQIIADPGGDPIARILCRSAKLRECIEAFGANPEPKLSELFPGLFTLSHDNSDGRTVSLILTEDAWDEPQFLQIIRETELNRDSARCILSKLIHRNREDAERMATILNHYDRDLAKSRQDQQVVHQFNTQLSQSFEEISALFKTAQILNSVNDPASAVSLACDEFASTIPFAWIAIWFRDGQQVAGGLRGRLTGTGPLPCSRESFISQADKLCATDQLSVWKEVLVPGQHEFATSIGSEILAEPILRDGAVVGLLLAGGKTNNDPEISSSEIQFMRAAANFIAVFHENRARFDEQRIQFLGTLRALAATIDAKDHYTRGHSQRVSMLVSKMASRLQLPALEVEQYRIAGLLHDIGKIGVPEAILQKAGKLTDDEFGQIKKHPQIGFNILKDVPSLQHILPGVLHHHERWDGRGYPGGLQAEQIPLIARCLAFADTFDAMSSSRSYRHALPREQTFSEIRRAASTQFDPDLVENFLALDFEEFDQLLAEAKVG